MVAPVTSADPSPAQPWRRATVGQVVVVDVGEETIECRVEAVADDGLTLAPLAEADAAYIPSLGRAATLLFSIPRRRVRTGGAVRPGDAPGRLTFAPGAAAGLPQRRRAARAGIELPVELTLLGDGGAPAGAPQALTTTDAGLGGLGVRVGAWSPPLGALLRLALTLPGGMEVTGTARVLRVEDGIAGLELDQMTPMDRTRLAALVLAGRVR